MEAVVKRETKGTKEITIQEKDLTLQRGGNTGKLVKVRLKNTRAMEMWYNKRITEENIQEIITLNIIRNGKSLALEVYPERSIYVKPNLGRINVSVFFIKTSIDRGVFEEIFGEMLKAQVKEKEKPMYVSFVLSCSLGFSAYSLLNRLNSLEFVDIWLDKETQKITLKRCFYDTSFKKQTLKGLERIYFQLKGIINVQINKWSLNTNDIRNAWELEGKQQEIKRFMLDVLEDVYWKELANVPEDQRHLDDRDFF